MNTLHDFNFHFAKGFLCLPPFWRFSFCFDFRTFRQEITSSRSTREKKKVEAFRDGYLVDSDGALATASAKRRAADIAADRALKRRKLEADARLLSTTKVVEWSYAVLGPQRAWFASDVTSLTDYAPLAHEQDSS